MATWSVARIGTNARRGYDDNGDNLGQLEVVFCGRNGNASKYYCPRIIGNFFFAHELHGLTRRLCAKKNGDRVGRTNLHECKEFFIYLSCGVVPSRHIGSVTTIRGLRPRLPSLRSVLPSRQIALNEIVLPTNCTNGHEPLQWVKWRPGRSHELSLMQGGGWMIEAGPVA